MNINDQFLNKKTPIQDLPHVGLMNSKTGLRKITGLVPKIGISLIFLLLSAFALQAQNSNADNSNIVYEGTHDFSACLEKLGCSDVASWGPCGSDEYPFSEQEAYDKAIHHIEFTLTKRAKVTAEVKNIKKCFNGCKTWFDQQVSGKWQYIDNTLWDAKPGTYRLNVLSDGDLGCGVPYKQTSFCPSSCIVTLKVYPVDSAVDPKNAVVINSQPKTRFDKPLPGILYYIDKECK